MSKKSICYSGFLGGPRSMGRVGYFFLSHLLERSEYSVSFKPFKKDYMAPHWENRFKSLIINTPIVIDQAVTYCSVLDAKRPRWARQMTPWLFYELNSLPRGVARGINRNDHVYTCSSFVENIFKEHGVTIPTSILGHGFDPVHFQYTKRSINGKFIFLSVAENTPRKNLPSLICSFERAFQNNDDVQLVLKLGLHGEGDIRQHIKQPEKIIISSERLEGDAQLAQLYQAAHCFVLPTRSEGFGMPILEAMATGLPVIVTNYSGHLDFCNEANSYLINNKGMVDSDTACFPYIKSQWADPDEDHLVHLMRHVFENYESALDVARTTHQSISANWTWNQQLVKSF